MTRRIQPTPYRQLLANAADAGQVPRGRGRVVIEAFVAQLAEAVWALGRLVVPGLGTFRVRARRARRATLPGVNGTVPARRVVACRVAKSWRARG